MINVGLVDVDLRVSSYLNEELAWVVDKRLQVISTTLLFKTTKELKGTSRFKFKYRDVAMWPVTEYLDPVIFGPWSKIL